MSFKSFIYLDEYKMYSISSQIFEGLTDKIVQSESENLQQTDNQNAPFWAGRTMANIVSKEFSSQKTKFLHDYSYSIFENEIISKNKKLLVIDKVIHDNIDFGCFDFIKITGNMLFIDMKHIKNITSNYDNILRAIANLATHKDRNDKINLLKQQMEKAQGQKKSEIQKRIKEVENYFDRNKCSSIFGNTFIPEQDVISDLQYIFDFGYGDLVESRINISHGDIDFIFTSIMNREYLRETEALYVKKYSRISEKPITVFGMITQSNQNNNTVSDMDIAPDNPKSLLINLTYKLMDIENNFKGKSQTEIVIDPIAIYREFDIHSKTT